VGLQGAGKTTNTAKLAAWVKKHQNKRPLLVACDIYRPAAIKQLETVGAQLDIPVFQMGQTNPVDIAKASIEHAKKHGNDIVFLDTAGRLHIDEALMAELQQIRDAVEPAEITASPPPLCSRFSATAMELFFLRRTAMLGSSCMSMTSSAWSTTAHSASRKKSFFMAV